MAIGKELIRAEEKDLDKLISFFRYLIEHTPDIEEHAHWIYGYHPNDESILSYIKSGAMHYMEEDGVILAAGAITDSQGEDYHGVPWQKNLADDEVHVLHIFGVNPDHQGQGVAKRFLRLMMERAKAAGKQAVRLDTLRDNTPAQHLYGSFGLTLCGTGRQFVENYGEFEFLFYEYLL